MSWRCSVCGYIEDGPNPPHHCPKCKAPASEFFKLDDPSVVDEPN